MDALLIGCGHDHTLRLQMHNTVIQKLVTLDNNPDTSPDVLHDLEVLPYPFEDESFGQIHAYEVLEHTGTQGDAEFFFGQFFEFWRILEPDGLLVGSCPAVDSPWLWGDPSHKRYIGPESFTFLDQDEYERQLGKTAMSDFRNLWKGDFKLRVSEQKDHTWMFALQANK